MIPKVFEWKDVSEILRVQGKDFLFTDVRIDRKSVPAELPYVYDIADGDSDGCIARIQPFVMVNYWGTILGKEPLELNEDGAYYPEYGSVEYEGCYDTAPDTLQDYMDGNYVSPDDEEDGSAAVMPETRYVMEFTPDGDVDDADIEDVLSGLGLREISIASNGATMLIKFTPAETVRMQEVTDSVYEFGFAEYPYKEEK